MTTHTEFLRDSRRHFLRRLRERYNLSMSADYYNLLCNNMDDAPKLAEIPGNVKSVRRIRYQKTTIIVIFDERYRKLDTCLSNDISIKGYVSRMRMGE